MLLVCALFQCLNTLTLVLCLIFTFNSKRIFPLLLHCETLTVVVRCAVIIFAEE